MDELLCDYCQESVGHLKCSNCRKARYCSKSCQKKHWYRHKFDCDPKKVTTADHLVHACMQDLIPTDYKTLEDWGFRKITSKETSMLLGLYQGLVKVGGVNAAKLHRWRKSGTLLQETKSFYEGLPKNNRGLYYPWFLEHQNILDDSPGQDAEPANETANDILNLAWKYVAGAGAPDMPSYIIHRTISQWEAPKYQCFAFVGTIKSGFHPGPNDRNYIYFGFCICDTMWHEMQLARRYQELLEQCTFDEFYDAFKKSRLTALFESKQISEWLDFYDEDQESALTDILSSSSSPSEIPSVWYLKRFVLEDPSKTLEEVDSFLRDTNSNVAVDYGFRNCKNMREYNTLKSAYKLFFDHPYIKRDVLGLHRASLQGGVYEYLSGVINLTDNGILLRRLMKNPNEIVDGADPHPSSYLDGK